MSLMIAYSFLLPQALHFIIELVVNDIAHFVAFSGVCISTFIMALNIASTYYCIVSIPHFAPYSSVFLSLKMGILGVI